MASIYELTGEYLRLASILDEAADSSDPSYQEALDALAQIADEIEGKAECYARIIKNAQSDIAGLKAEEQRLNAARKAKEKTVERLKAAMLDAMQTTGMSKVHTSIGKWSIKKNSMSVNVIDETKVPERFLRYAKPEVNKLLMLSEHKLTGEEFEGVEFVQNDGVQFR